MFHQDELYHYGVLGMKWGVRRARKKGTTYTYKSHGQKKFEKKLTRLQKTKKPNSNKISKVNQKLDMYKTRDKNRQKFAESTSVGNAVIRALLLGPVGAGTYNRLRASGFNSKVSYLYANYLPLPFNVIVSRGAEEKTANR